MTVNNHIMSITYVISKVNKDYNIIKSGRKKTKALIVQVIVSTLFILPVVSKVVIVCVAYH